MQAGVGTLTVGDFALFVYYLSFVSSLSFGEFMALYKQTEVSLSAWRPCCKAPAETLVAHNPLYLNDLRGRKSKLPPWSNRAGMRTIAHELRACNLTYYYPDTGRGINLMLPRAVLPLLPVALVRARRRAARTVGLLPMERPDHRSG